jgi:hypothetical protein
MKIMADISKKLRVVVPVLPGYHSQHQVVSATALKLS